MGLKPDLMAEYDKLKEVSRKEQNKKELVEWSEPIPFDEDNLPAFPVDVFPPWLSEYVKGVAESTQTPIDAAGMATIAILSTALAKKFFVQLTGEWSESLNTYSILALPPGNRKSSVFKALQEPITIFEQEERERLAIRVSEQKTKIRTLQKRVEQLEKEYAKNGDKCTLSELYALTSEIEEEDILTIPRFITEDVTPEKLADLMAGNNEKMALLSAEGGGIFSIMAGRYSSDGKANLEIFLKGFSGDYCAIDRVGRETKVLKEPALTIGLFLQPQVVHSVPSSFLERGLMARFLYSFPHSIVGYRKISPPSIGEEIKKKYHQNIKKLLRIDANESIRLNLSVEAIEAEKSFRAEIETMFLEGGELAEMKEWGSKLAGQIIRASGLLHVAEQVESLQLDNPNPEGISRQVNKDTFVKARHLSSYFIEHAKAAYGNMKADKGVQNAKYLLGVIKRQNKLTIPYRDIQLLTNKRFHTASELQASFRDLEERGFINKRKEGRKMFYDVNPLIFRL